MVVFLRRALALCLLFTNAPAHHDGHDDGTKHLKIGVTLHPYYSWTKNIVGTVGGIEVRGVIPAEVDAGSYQPAPEDVVGLVDLDAIVINGLGHDDFILDMIRASGNEDIVVIRPNEQTPVIRSTHGDAVNSHTFISFSNAIQQTYAIQRKLAEFLPEHAEDFSKNAAEYAKRLRKIKNETALALSTAEVTRVVTVHDGYSYLLQELGLELASVVEPAHGLVPSAQELGKVIDLVRRERISVIFSEEGFPEALLKTLTEETSARVYQISHVASGPWAADKFELEMKANAKVMIEALVGGE